MIKSNNYIILLISVISAAGCFSYPRWIERLPENQDEYFVLPAGYRPRSDYSGLWKRHVETRFGTANRVAVSDGTEEIRIYRTGSGASAQNAGKYRYEKIHIYYELVTGEHREIHYRETGSLTSVPPYLHFVPEDAAIYESKKIRVFPSRRNISRADLTVSQIRPEDLKRTDPPGPLLYYFDPQRDMIIPMTYDRFNRYYDFGIFEGTTGEYDHLSEFFHASVRRYADLRIHSHGYKFVYNKDNH